MKYIDPMTEARRVQMINSLFFNTVDEMLLEEQYVGLTDAELITDNLENIYRRVFTTIIDHYSKGSADSSLSAAQQSELAKVIESSVDWRIEGNTYEITGLKGLYVTAAHHLAQEGITVRLAQEDPTVGAEEQDVEHKTLESWQQDHVSVSDDASMDARLKRKLGRLPLTDADGRAVLDDLDFPLMVPYHTVKQKLFRTLSGSVDASDMYSRLQDLGARDARFRPIVGAVDRGSINMTAIYTAFAKAETNFLRVFDDGEQWKVTKNNQSDGAEVLLQEARDRFNDPELSKLLEKDGSINAERAALWGKAMSKAIDKGDTQRIHDILPKVGLDISKKVLDEGGFLTGPGSLNTFVGAIEQGGNPFKGSGEYTALRKMYRAVADNTDAVYPSSMLNVERKSIQRFLMPGFITNLIDRWKGPNGQQIIDRMASDPLLSGNIWVRNWQNPLDRQKIELTLVDGLEQSDRRVNVDKMSPYDLQTLSLAAYYNGGATAGWLRLGVLADAPKMIMLKATKKTERQVRLDIFEALMGEARRIDVNSRSSIPGHKRADQFLSIELPELKKAPKENVEAWLSENKSRVLADIQDVLLKEAVEYKSRLLASGAAYQDGDAVRLRKMPTVSAEQTDTLVRQYIANQRLGFILGTQVTSGDLSQYKNSADFANSNKQIYSPRQPLDAQATWKGEAISPTYRAIYLRDEIVPSDLWEKTLEPMFRDHPEYAAIKKAYTEVNVTDAQTFITPQRYRQIMIGLARWDEKFQEAYELVMSGKPLPQEKLLRYFGPIKPYTVTQQEVFTDSGERVLNTVQHKNSEVVLLPQFVTDHPKLQAVYDYMQGEAQVDTVLFESAVKVGGHGYATMNTIGEALVHTLDNADYGLQQETPNHFLDDNVLFGTQIRKLIWEGVDLSLPGMRELFDEYQQTLVKDVRDSYDKLVKEMGSLIKVKNLLLDEVYRRGEDIQYWEEALTIRQHDGKDEFTMPLWLPGLFNNSQLLLSSVFNFHIIKQKTSGMQLVQVSSVGLSDDLKVVMNDDGGVKHMEVMLPAWTKDLFGGNIDFNKLDEILGYRIPTEGKHSMSVLKLKGILPAYLGGIIMLPKEINAISGSGSNFRKFIVWTGTSAIEKRIITIMKTVLQHPSQAERLLRPNNIYTLNKIYKDINETLGRNAVVEDATSILWQDLMYTSFNNGKSSIKAFAIHNVHHALIQPGNVKFSNNIVLGNIGIATLSHHDKRVPEQLASLYFAASGNTRSLVLSKLNINKLTADFVAAMIRARVPLEEVIYLINTLKVREFTQRYFNAGASYQAARLIEKQMIFESGLDDTFWKMKMPQKKSYQQDLIKSNHYEPLRDFLYYQKNHTRPLLQLIMAMQFDTNNLGPTLVGFVQKIRQQQKVFSHAFGVTGHASFFKEQSRVPGITAFHIYGNLVIEELLTNLNLFPYLSTAFCSAEMKLQKIINRSLNMDERKAFQQHLPTYLLSSHPYFNETVSNLVERVYLAKESDPINEMLFIKALRVEKKKIVFRTELPMGSAQQAQIRNEWDWMFQQTGWIRALADDLAKYVYHTYGLQYKRGNFAYLLPVSFWSNPQLGVDGLETSLVDYLLQKANELDDVDFASKYAHHFAKVKF